MERDPGSGTQKDFYSESEQRNQASHVGKVLKVHPNHRLDVALLTMISPNGQFIVLRGIPFGASYAGPGWGIHSTPGPGQLVQVELNNGSTVGATVSHAFYTEGMEPSPKHPLLTENNGGSLAWALQNPINDHLTPGNIDYRDASGNRVDIILNKQTRETSGSEINRTSGPSISAPEAKISEGKAKLEQSTQAISRVATLTRDIATLSTQLADTTRTLKVLQQTSGTSGEPPSTIQLTRESLEKEINQLTIGVRNKTLEVQSLTQQAADHAKAGAEATIESAMQLITTTKQKLEVGMKAVITAGTMDPTSLELV